MRLRGAHSRSSRAQAEGHPAVSSRPSQSRHCQGEVGRTHRLGGARAGQALLRVRVRTGDRDSTASPQGRHSAIPLPPWGEGLPEPQLSWGGCLGARAGRTTPVRVWMRRRGQGAATAPRDRADSAIHHGASQAREGPQEFEVSAGPHSAESGPRGQVLLLIASGTRFLRVGDVTCRGLESLDRPLLPFRLVEGGVLGAVWAS